MEHLLNLFEYLKSEPSNRKVAVNEKEWLCMNTEILKSNIAFLESGELSTKFPKTYSLIRYRVKHLKKILILFTKLVNFDCRCRKSSLPLFWASYDDILINTKISTNRTRLNETLTLFGLLGLLYKLDDKMVRLKVLNTANRIQEKYKLLKHCNFYFVPQYTDELFNEVEKRATILKEFHFRINSANKEWVLRTFGKEIANILFPQYKEENANGTTKKSNQKTKQLERKILASIEKQDYILEKEIKKSPQWGISKNEILKNNNLKCVKLNKELKELFKITCKGYPNIIYKRT